MSTVAEVREERETHNGRKIIAAFRAYHEERGLELSVDNLRAWDVAHNHSRILQSFGTEAEIREKGLQIFYREYLNRFTTAVIQMKGGKAFRISCVRTKADGSRGHVAVMGRVDLDFNIDKIKAEIKTSYQRAALLGLDIRAFRKIVNDALDQIESEA